jgi:hypothetical protein
MCFVNSPVAIMVSRADKRCSIRMFILFTDALYESFSASKRSEIFISPCLYCFMASNCYLPLSPVAMLFLFFDSKQNSLHSYFPEAIVIFLCVINLVLQLLNIYFGFMDFMFSFKTSKYPISLLRQSSSLDL